MPDHALGVAIRFHHVGVITENLGDSVDLYGSLGYSESVVYSDPLQKARIVLMQKQHDPVIELISPDSPDSPAASWIKRIQAGPYHTCYEVGDLERVQGYLRCHHRLFPVFGPAPAVAFNMKRVVFLWGTRSGLIELLESDIA